MNGIKVLDRPASQNFYAVAGRLLFVRCSDLRLAAEVEQLFSGWQLTPVSLPDPHPDIKISFSICDNLPNVPAGVSEFEVAEGGRCQTTVDGFYLTFENSLLSLAHSGVVNVAVCQTRICDRIELARVTSFAVCAALRRFDVFELHSAGVVIPETNSGVLIIGSSGSGKSTLTSQLASSGWGYLSDDEVLLSLNENEVEARGFRTFFALRQDGPSKHCFTPSDVFNSHPIAKATPKYLLFSELRHQDKSRMHELTQPETMSRLIRACPWATYDTLVAGKYLAMLSKLARQTKAFTLQAGTDLLDPSEASRVIGSVCPT